MREKRELERGVSRESQRGTVKDRGAWEGIKRLRIGRDLKRD